MRVVGHSLMILTCGSFQMEQSCVYSSCQIGGAGCSMRAMPPLCWMCRNKVSVFCRRVVPIIVCSCCFCVRCGSPVGCVLDMSFGGPCMVLPFLSVKGFPLATEHVSQGGAKMAVCT